MDDEVIFAEIMWYKAEKPVMTEIQEMETDVVQSVPEKQVQTQIQ